MLHLSAVCVYFSHSISPCVYYLFIFFLHSLVRSFIRFFIWIVVIVVLFISCCVCCFIFSIYFIGEYFNLGSITEPNIKNHMNIWCCYCCSRSNCVCFSVCVCTVEFSWPKKQSAIFFCKKIQSKSNWDSQIYAIALKYFGALVVWVLSTLNNDDNNFIFVNFSLLLAVSMCVQLWLWKLIQITPKRKGI